MRRRFGWLVVLLASSLAAAAAEQPLSRVHVVGVDSVQQAAALRALGFDVLAQSVTATSFDVIVSHNELAQIKLRGLTVSSRQEGRPVGELVKVHTRGGVPSGYMDLAALNQHMNDVAAAHSSIARVVDLTSTYGAPTTVGGRHIFALKISDNVALDEDEVNVMFVSNHHARELVTPVIALEAMDRFTGQYGIDPAITATVDNHEIWIAPTWNPDGYHHVFTADNLWRKNRRVFPTGIGVDQNRNYPQGWATTCGGSTSASSQTYRGDSAASEAETQTMMAWSRERRFAKVIDFHSFGREVLYSYDCSTHPFTAWFGANAFALADASGYPGSARAAGAEGEHYQWQLGQMGAWAHLIETANDFQPTYASAQNEAALVWPGILHAIDAPISLVGHVVDAWTTQPLAAAITLTDVAFVHGESNASGGPFGRYHVFAPGGIYTVEFSSPGYETQSHDVVLADGISVGLDVAMQPIDNDGDGVADASDNCTAVPNADQRDTDNDGYGNVCDADLNGDLIVNAQDLGILRVVFFSMDEDADFNGDSLVNALDLGIMKSRFFMPPGPSGLTP